MLKILLVLTIAVITSVGRASSNEVKAQVACQSQQFNSRAFFYGETIRWQNNDFVIAMKAGDSLLLDRTTGRFEPPSGDCVGIGCVAPIVEGTVRLKMVSGPQVIAIDEQGHVLFAGAGLYDMRALNGYACSVSRAK